MVDLDPVGEEDIAVLQEMLEKHHRYTGSTLAGFVLEDLANQLKSFVKIFPREYKKVLQGVGSKQTANHP
jgi:glutamate synthase (NADPH/NADH) large chain